MPKPHFTLIFALYTSPRPTTLALFSMRKHFAAILSVLCTTHAFGQFEKYSHVYPMGHDPNVRWMSTYSEYEQIQFEANPIIKFSFHNNFVKRLADTTKLHSHAQYIDFRPQFRLYKEESQPIKTPSYRIFLGTQHLFRLKNPFPTYNQFIGFQVQSGHHSNGQSKCTFAEDEFDNGRVCEAIYDSITADTDLSALLNRKNGNYSVNLSEFTINYRLNKLGMDGYAKQTHSFMLGYVVYHKGIFGVADVDLVTDNDLNILGRHRMSLSYEYIIAFQLSEKSKIRQRVRIKQHIEAIFDAHPHINPIRFESSITYYPLSMVSALGISFSFIYGHDNYNYRIVDSGSQFTAGLTWDLFSPVRLSN